MGATRTAAGWPAACIWLSYGETDEFGHHAVEDKVHMHDWHATMLHLLGMDHEKLTFLHNGRPFRLTDVHGEVVTEILA